MKKLLSFACSVLLAAVMSTNAHAFFTGPYMQDWSIDPDGAGSMSAVSFAELINYQSMNQIILDLTGNFRNVGTVLFTDPGIKTDNIEITAVYDLFGTKSGNLLNFTSGSITLYSDTTPDYSTADGFFGADNGVKVATMTFELGSGMITSLTNGVVNIAYKLDMLNSGYLFDSLGNDIADLMLDYDVYSEATSNFSVTPVNTLTKNEFTAYTGSNGTFYVSSNGQVRLNAVPEPATVMLMGAGFLGLALIGRKKIVK